MREYLLWLAKIVTLLLLVCVAVPVFVGMLLGASQVLKAGKGVARDHRVGVVNLTGEITESKDVVNDIDQFAQDDSIDGIVLDIDSPGGAVGPSETIYSTVLRAKLKKPVVASLGGMAASGGYYVAVACNKIISQPSSLTGSIGVIMQLPNFRKVAAMVGVDMVTIKSGRLKDVGNSFRDMTEEERLYLEATAGAVHQNFISAVVTGRSMDRAKITALADGRVFVGSDAIKLGLVDQLGDLHLAARTVYDVLGKPLPALGENGSEPALVYPDDSLREVKKLLGKVKSSVAVFTGTTAEVKFLAPF